MRNCRVSIIVHPSSVRGGDVRDVDGRETEAESTGIQLRLVEVVKSPKTPHLPSEMTHHRFLYLIIIGGVIFLFEN